MTPESVQETREYWNRTLENNPFRAGRKETDTGAFLSLQIEAAGDILRELAGNRDPGYYGQKIELIERSLTDPEWYRSLSAAERNRLGETRRLLKDLPADDPEMAACKALVEAIIGRNPETVKAQLEALRLVLQEETISDRLGGQSSVTFGWLTDSRTNERTRLSLRRDPSIAGAYSVVAKKGTESQGFRMAYKGGEPLAKAMQHFEDYLNTDTEGHPFRVEIEKTEPATLKFKVGQWIIEVPPELVPKYTAQQLADVTKGKIIGTDRIAGVEYYIVKKEGFRKGYDVGRWISTGVSAAPRKPPPRKAKKKPVPRGDARRVPRGRVKPGRTWRTEVWGKLDRKKTEKDYPDIIEHLGGRKRGAYSFFRKIGGKSPDILASEYDEMGVLPHFRIGHAPDWLMKAIIEELPYLTAEEQAFGPGLPTEEEAGLPEKVPVGDLELFDEMMIQGTEWSVVDTTPEGVVIMDGPEETYQVFEEVEIDPGTLKKSELTQQQKQDILEEQRREEELAGIERPPLEMELVTPVEKEKPKPLPQEEIRLGIKPVVPEKKITVSPVIKPKEFEETELARAKAEAERERVQIKLEPTAPELPGVPEIKPSLEYEVLLEDDKVIKTPKKGFEFKVERDYNVFQALGDLAPRTEYDATNNRLIQEAVRGRFATEEEREEVRALVKAKGYTPVALMEWDVIVTPEGTYKVVDVGQFEKIEPVPVEVKPEPTKEEVEKAKAIIEEAGGVWADDPLLPPLEYDVLEGFRPYMRFLHPTTRRVITVPLDEVTLERVKAEIGELPPKPEIKVTVEAPRPLPAQVQPPTRAEVDWKKRGFTEPFGMPGVGADLVMSNDGTVYMLRNGDLYGRPIAYLERDRWVSKVSGNITRNWGKPAEFVTALREASELKVIPRERAEIHVPLPGTFKGKEYVVRRGEKFSPESLKALVDHVVMVPHEPPPVTVAVTPAPPPPVGPMTVDIPEMQRMVREGGGRWIGLQLGARNVPCFVRFYDDEEITTREVMVHVTKMSEDAVREAIKEARGPRGRI